MHLFRLLVAFLFLAVNASAAEQGRQIVFLVGDSEYKTAATVPAWAKATLEPRGIVCTFLIDDPTKPFDFPQLAGLEKADALFISIRRRGIPPEQMKAIRAFVESGKPVIGIRTASHAFDPKKPADGEAVWPTFDRDVFGGHYQNHYGKGPATLADVRRSAGAHPILDGFPRTTVKFSSHLYKCRDLATTTTLLLTGRLEGQPEVEEPLAWVDTYEKRKAFYTSLGSPEDFQQPEFSKLLLNATLFLLGEPASIPAK
jgi:type 1 glutamine amidotransferase